MMKEIGKSIQQFTLSMIMHATGAQQARNSNAAACHTMPLAASALVRKAWKKLQHPHQRHAHPGGAVGLAGVALVLGAEVNAAAVRVPKAFRASRVGVAVIQD